MAGSVDSILSSDLYANFYYGQQNQLISNIFSTAQQSTVATSPDLLSSLLAPSGQGGFLSNTANSLLLFSQKVSALASSANMLSNTSNGGLFASRVATSTDQTIALATAQAGANLGTYQLTVNQLATVQQLESNNLNPAVLGVPAATYTFAISADDVSTDVTITVASGDTNGTVLNNLAQAINATAFPQATATVVTDSSGNQRLQLTSSQTGKANAVTVSDVTGNLASQLGLTSTATATSTAGGVSQQGLDAAYVLGGVSLTSSTNQAELAGGVQATFESTGSSTIQVQVGPDVQGTSTAVNNFVSRYNDAIGFAQTAGLGIPADFVEALTDVASGFQQQLAAVGISTASDGSLSVDQNQLNTAISTNFQAVTSLFNGSTGLAAGVSGATSTVQSNIQSTVGSVLGPSFASSSPLVGFSASTSPFSFGLTYDSLGGLVLPMFQGLFSYLI